MKWLARLVFVVPCLAALSSCGDKSSSSSSPASPSMDRSATCLAFQDAGCDWRADKCKMESRAACDDDFQSLFCKDDGVMQACIDAFAAAPCGATPAACLGVADTAPAQAGCDQFTQQVCDLFDRCSLQDKASCLTDAAASVPCANVVGLGPAFPQCQADLAALSCPPSGGKVVLPASCKGVLKQVTSALTDPRAGWHVEAVSTSVASFEPR